MLEIDGKIIHEIAVIFELPYQVVKTKIDDASRLYGVYEAELIVALSATLAKLKWQLGFEEFLTIIVPIVEVFQDGLKASEIFNISNVTGEYYSDSNPISKNNGLLPVD